MPISKIKTSSITADAASVNLNIDANTLFLDVANNRVGLGTTSPSSQLSVYGIGGDAVFLSSAVTTTGAADTGNGITFGGSDGSNHGRLFGRVGVYKENSTVGDVSSYMSFGTRLHPAGTVEKIRIDSVGNFLIGITDTNPPTSANAFAFSKLDNTLRFSNTTANGKVWTIGTSTPGIASQGDFFSFGRYSGAAWAEVARFTSGGNLGLGNTAPTNKLHILSTTGLPSNSLQPEAALLIGEPASSRCIGIGTYSGGTWIQSSYPGTAGPAYTISLNPNGGDIIIADTAPQYSARLYVNGAIAARNGGVDGTFQSAFVAGYTSNYNEKNIIQTAVSTAATGSGFRFQVSNGAGSAGVTTALDVLRAQTTSHNGMIITSGQQQTGTVTTDGSGNAQILVSGWSWGEFNSYTRNIFVMFGVRGGTYFGAWTGVMHHAQGATAISTASANGSGGIGSVSFTSNGTSGNRWFQLSGVPANSTFDYTIRGFALTESFRSNYGAF